MREIFRHLAARTSATVGSPAAFMLAFTVVMMWLITGPLFGFSNTWQLVINTATTIITFLMVFLIQNTQNRDARAMHLKLDELLRGVKGARTELVDIEELSDAELEKLHKEFHDLHLHYAHEYKKRKAPCSPWDTHCEIDPKTHQKTSQT